MSENMQQCPSCGELVPTEYVVCVWCGFDLTAEHIRRSGIKIGRREAFGRMRKVIVDPLNAFKEISLIPDLTGGKLVFYLIGLAMTLNMIAIFGKLENLDYNTAGILFSWRFIEIKVRFLVNIALLIVQPFVLYGIFMVIWRTAARILSLFSRSVGGRGDKTKIRAAVGYSMVPVLLAWSLSWIIRLLTPATTVDGSVTYQSVEDSLVGVAEEGFGVVAVVFLWIGWLWSTGLGIIGMRNASRLSYIEAIIVAGIPYAVFMTIAL